jgi:predicted DNA-binding transcriptional regulator AlpA
MEYNRNIDRQEAQNILGIKSKSYFYVLIQKGVIPPPVKPSPKMSIWQLSDIMSLREKIFNGEIKF